MRFDQHPNIFKKAKAAIAFLDNVRNAELGTAEYVVVRIGRKFACVKRTFAQRMKLRIIK